MELTQEQLSELEKTQYLSLDDSKEEKSGSLKEERRIIHFISTPHLDRGRDIMNPKGMDSAEFELTKTVFNNHDYSFPIGSNVKLLRTSDGVKATTYFSKDKEANDIYNMHLEGVINNWSIGFGAVRDKTGKVKEGSVIYDDKSGIRTFEEWKLNEYSDTGIPMNVNCYDLAKSICKSDRVIKAIDYSKSILLVNESILKQDEEIKELKSLIEQLKATDNNAVIAELKNEIESQKKTLEKLLGDENEKMDYNIIRKQVRAALVGSFEENTGRKYKQ